MATRALFATELHLPSTNDHGIYKQGCRKAKVNISECVPPPCERDRTVIDKHKIK